MQSERRLLLEIVSMVAIFVASAPVCRSQAPPAPGDADESQPANDGSPQSSSLPVDASPESLPEDVVYLQGPTGERVPVSAVSLEDYLEWLKRQGERQYGIKSISLTGKVDAGWAFLSARLEILINRDKEWVRVPLALNEAILLDWDASGDGDVSPNDNSEPINGYSWWFRGKGSHELKLNLLVPVLKQTPARRLQLQLPATAISRLLLEVPLPQISVKPSEKSRMTVRPKETSGTEIEISGLGKRLDLQWHPLPDQERVATVLEANTLLSVGFPDEGVLIEANQEISALQGSFEQVTVRLPGGFELRDLKGVEISDHRVDPNQPNHVTVNLTGPTTGPVKFRWTLESSFPETGGRLLLDGFEVVGARNQVGEIAVRRTEGYRITKRDDEDRFVHRIGRGEAVGPGRLATAYRFFGQPFRLGFDVKQIEPYFTAKPSFTLNFLEGQTELEANFQFNVSTDRGTLANIELNWPNWKSNGWVLKPLEPPGQFEDFFTDVDEGSDTIQIPLVSRRTGIFPLVLRATRTSNSDNKPIVFDLPSVRASSRLPATLEVRSDDNIEAEVSPIDKTSLVPMPVESPRTGARSFRIDSQQRAFSAKVTVHDQEIATAATATAELRDNRLLITQRIAYDVAFERLPRIRLLVPDEIVQPVEFALSLPDAPDSAQKLAPNWTEREGYSTRQAGLILPVPSIGQFDIVATFLVELPDKLMPGQEIPADIPLIQASDAQFASIRFHFKNLDQIQADVIGDEWQRRPSSRNTADWVADTPEAAVPLRLSHSMVHPSQDYSIRKGLIRSAFDPAGYARSRAQYRVDGSVSTIICMLPTGTTAQQFWWNDRILPPSDVSEVPVDSGRYRLVVSETLVQGNNLLTVDYSLESASPFGWTDTHELLAPQFPPNVWVEETVWEILLPYNQHLFIEPAGFTPHYRWSRDTIFYSRSPTTEFSDLDLWISTSDGPSLDSVFSRGNAYLLSRFGPTTSIAFRSMSQSIVVLFGAGLALAVGFLLMKVPLTRNVLSALAAAFIVAAASVWYTAPVQLLLQPALLGLLLAIAAVLIDATVKREKSPAVLTLPSPSDFGSQPGLPSTIERSRHSHVEAEEQTAVRPVPHAPPEPVSSSDSGDKP
jgi:hypothetical protein